MGTASIKLISRPPKADLLFRGIQREINKQLQTVGRAHVNERKAIVDNFDTEINFGFETKVSSGQITLTVNVTNASAEVSEGFTVGDLWKALDKTGTKPHVIKPKNPNGVLRFQWGGPGSYNPKTRPIGRSGGPGTVSGGQVTFRKQVNHPGFPPRKFSDKINKRLRRQFEQAVSRGIRIGAKR